MDIDIARMEDAPIIQKYLPDSDNGSYIQKWLEAQSCNENLLLVAWETNEDGSHRPVGRVTLVMTPPGEEISRFLGEKIGRVEALLVNERMRRRGIGQKLMFRLEDEAEKRGFNAIQLGVEPKSLPAVNLYKKLGYRDWGHGPVTTSWIENRGGTKETVSVQTDVLIKNLDKTG